VRRFRTLPSLRIPEEKSTVFVYPDYTKWQQLLQANRICTDVVPGRAQARSELLERASDYTKNVCAINELPPAAGPIIAAGHQALWHHCGIWAKDVVASRFAHDVGGVALHLVLDHDLSDTAMAIPNRAENDCWHSSNIAFEAEPVDVPLECRPVPPSDVLARCSAQLGRIGPTLPGDIDLSNLADLMIRSPAAAKNIADFITCVQANMSCALGIKQLYLPVSQLSQNTAFVEFVTEIIFRATEFAHTYNESIDRMDNSSSRKRPSALHRLEIDSQNNSTELPFWLISPSRRRLPLHVRLQKGNTLGLYADSTELGSVKANDKTSGWAQLSNVLQESGFRLRPKAVSLTLFVRLFLADWFIHGIGGASYEPVTDYLIEQYYRLSPLVYGVATATATLPLPPSTNPPENVRDLQHQLHRMKHNPEKHIDQSMRRDESVAALVDAKRSLLEQMNQPDLARSRKQSLWSTLAQLNASLFAYAQDARQQIVEKIELAHETEQSQKVRNSREYFFGLFPRHMLQTLAQTQ